mgnify:CR=1 FL=1
MSQSPETDEILEDQAPRRPKFRRLSEANFKWLFPERVDEVEDDPMGKLTPQLRARLLYNYCIASEKKVSETLHNLFIIAEHYSAERPGELESPQPMNGLPPFFGSLTADEKAAFCYNQVVEALSLEAMPVTVESLRATKRTNPNDPWSSYAGRFVRQVTWYVIVTLAAMIVFFFQFNGSFEFFPKAEEVIIDGALEVSRGLAIQWIAFGCLGALVHLLNHALTATRLQTFEVSEARKVGPRLLLGGMFGFVVPWTLVSTVVEAEDSLLIGSVAAFFGGYSVRFSISLLERLLAAIMPDTSAKA